MLKLRKEKRYDFEDHNCSKCRKKISEATSSHFLLLHLVQREISSYNHYDHALEHNNKFIENSPYYPV